MLDVGEASEPSGELDEASPTPGLGAAEAFDLNWRSGEEMVKLLRHRAICRRNGIGIFIE